MSKKLTADQITDVQDAYKASFWKMNSGELQAMDSIIAEMADLAIYAGKTGNAMLRNMMGVQMREFDIHIQVIIKTVAQVGWDSGKSADQVLTSAGCVGAGITEMYRARTVAA